MAKAAGLKNLFSDSRFLRCSVYLFLYLWIRKNYMLYYFKYPSAFKISNTLASRSSMFCSFGPWSTVRFTTIALSGSTIQG